MLDAAPYDLTAELPAGSADRDRAALVVAAFAVTLCRWTAVGEAAIAVGGRVIRLQVDDHALIDDFLRADHPTRGADDGPVDLVIASEHADLRSGEVRFTTEVPDAAHGFIADVAAAVDEMTSLDGPLEDVRCIAPERRRILDALVGADVPAVDIETLFLEQVRRRPREVAVRDASVELTYEQLAHAADQYAGVLRSAGVRPGDTVLVATRRSVGEVVALLGIIRLGAAYAGFDDDAPEARLSRIIGKLAPAVAVTDASTADHPALHELTCVDSWQPGQHDDRPLDWTPGSPDPHRTAYIAFTSGSTGEPKGVVVPHHAVTRLALTTELQVRPGDRVLRMAPLAFDASTYEIWVALLNGATLEAFPAKLPTVGKLEKFFKDNKISVAWLTASLFRLVAQSRPRALAGLRWLVSGGEVVPHEAVARVLDLHPGLVITNGYGPTENTTFTTTHTVRDSAEIDGPLPIGRPIAGTKVFVLDHNARLLPPGAVGELYAAGSGLADGYLDDETETKGRFGHFSPDVGERLYRTGDLVRLDPSGNVVFLGRVDKQVKLDGHRIEPEEISTALVRHPDVRDAVIVVSRQANRSAQLVAAVVLRPGTDADPRSLRTYLSDLLPSYAIPAQWVVVDEIPLTRNGKVDEQALLESATRPVSA
ncbi:amino acid adenylation domain-containing protein [Allokutzneria sp. A3M-2-11 16]|uniref:amino acid adenylation domain-containing protein n=1 Tax=Allokutzneria sp. A3M-2-11 16 TaxID=2962043 RepID=UPI0020B644A6|nr:amino acid adenylation domain-containing protein [Allokutzneria sp. A3M-2-11 16]MCP3800880.1 amino acid adenylation domain-containing protein [Allokutzneria sp. A3M-2-11 16]